MARYKPTYAEVRGRTGDLYNSRQARISARFEDKVAKSFEDFFDELPKIYRKSAVANIYKRALMPMRDAIRGNIQDHTGALRKTIIVRSSRGNKRNPDPRAWVVPRKPRKGTEDPYWAYFLEYGTADRFKKKKQRGPWNRWGDTKYTTTAHTGYIQAPSVGFFRGGVDATFADVKTTTVNYLYKFGEDEMKKQIRKYERSRFRAEIKM